MALTATPRGQRKEGAFAPHTARQIANVADPTGDGVTNNVQGQHVLLACILADGATATTTYVCDKKWEITNVRVQKRGGAGGASDTVQVQDSAGAAISDAISINIANKLVAVAASIDIAKAVVSAGGTFKIVKTKASAANVACMVEVIGLLRA
jgi:hypothetical protein